LPSSSLTARIGFAVRLMMLNGLLGTPFRSP
jgi:hypothetical protein